MSTTGPREPGEEPTPSYAVKIPHASLERMSSASRGVLRTVLARIGGLAATDPTTGDFRLVTLGEPPTHLETFLPPGATVERY